MGYGALAQSQHPNKHPIISHSNGSNQHVKRQILNQSVCLSLFFIRQERYPNVIHYQPTIIHVCCGHITFVSSCLISLYEHESLYIYIKVVYWNNRDTEMRQCVLDSLFGRWLNPTESLEHSLPVPTKVNKITLVLYFVCRFQSHYYVTEILVFEYWIMHYLYVYTTQHLLISPLYYSNNQRC